MFRSNPKKLGVFTMVMVSSLMEEITRILLNWRPCGSHFEELFRRSHLRTVKLVISTRSKWVLILVITAAESVGRCQSKTEFMWVPFTYT